MPTPDTPRKIRYSSRSVEVHVGRPRSEVWPDVVAVIAAQEPTVELSVEPPWRFAYEMSTEGSGLSFWQSTVLIRDDGPTCHVAWSLVFDPDPEPSTLAAADQILDAMRTALDRLANHA